MAEIKTKKDYKEFKEALEKYEMEQKIKKVEKEHTLKSILKSEVKDFMEKFNVSENEALSVLGIYRRYNGREGKNDINKNWVLVYVYKVYDEDYYDDVDYNINQYKTYKEFLEDFSKCKPNRDDRYFVYHNNKRVEIQFKPDISEEMFND